MATRQVLSAVLIVLAAALLAPTVAHGQGVMATAPIEGGSWTWGNAWWTTYGFDQIKWVWRLDLSTGLGPWTSPYVDDFRDGLWGTGTPDASWGVDIGTPYYMVASGDLTGIGSGNWASHYLHFDGALTAGMQGGYNAGLYKNGQWQYGATWTFGVDGAGDWWWDSAQLTETAFDSYPPVPEPAWLSIIGLGLVGTMAFRRLRKRA